MKLPNPPPTLGPIHRLSQVDSTNEQAFRALQGGKAQHGWVCIAGSQSAGRGRMGKAWESPSGHGLYLSAVWQPKLWIAVPLLTMASGMAARNCLLDLGVGPLELKWPNDVMHVGPGQRSKLAGILVESRGLDPAQPTFVVGIGINVGQTHFPPDLLAQQAVTSLTLLGSGASLAQVEEHLLVRLAQAWQAAEHEPKQTCAQFLAATGLAGKEVSLDLSAGPIAGRVVGLDAERGLGLAGADGANFWVRLEQIRALTPAPG